MSARKGWIFGPPPPNPYSVEAWAERHRRDGHHPRPAPTTENPERWDCECGYIWCILTEKQTRQKWYTMMGAAHLLPTRITR
jgi:hypothetical protein